MAHLGPVVLELLPDERLFVRDGVRVAGIVRIAKGQHVLSSSVEEIRLLLPSMLDEENHEYADNYHHHNSDNLKITPDIRHSFI